MTPTRNPWIALSALCLGFFMIMVDTTIVNIAVPVILEDLNAGLDQVLWVANAYVLTYAALLVAAGRLGDLFGQKRLYLAGLLVFTASSAWCGLVDSIGPLIAARALQGLGAALLTPQTTAFIALLFVPERRGAAYGMWSGVAGLATITGPLLGGLVVTRFGWEWLFFINVPIGVVCLVMVVLLVPGHHAPRRTGLDLPGIALVSGGLFALSFGVLEGERYGWGTIAGPLSIPLVLGASVVLLRLFALQQRRSPHPLIPGSLLAYRNFTLANGIVAIVSFALAGSLLLLTLYLQTALGLTPLRAGLTTAPLSAAFGVVGIFVGRRSTAQNSKGMLVRGLVCYGVGLGGTLALASPDVTAWWLLAPMLVCGIGLGCVFAPMSNLAMGQLDRNLAGAASGVYNTTRQVGNVLGSAAVGALFQGLLGGHALAPALRLAMILPLAVLLVAVACCLALGREPAPRPEVRAAQPA
ncbi:DHA2 family efflux MFS transporter permease subunit [Streptomyces sp. NPDC089919]|uniref:DHA2 family efflux MFS transporter permease subunit n=1 Tax=Streptomyces sp. NPDC089919 TaxID=3155188 RepID=UPI003436460C